MEHKNKRETQRAIEEINAISTVKTGGYHLSDDGNMIKIIKNIKIMLIIKFDGIILQKLKGVNMLQ